jgi:hypothetical protein
LHHEKITGESWLLRDKFLTTTDRHAANKSMVTNPQKLRVKAIKKLIHHALEVQGIREPLEENEHRHEFKTTHGLRKYFKTKTVAAGMDPLNVELLMDHTTGLADDYYRPTEQALQDDYINKGLDYLTINKDTKIANQLQKHVTELTEKGEQENHAILEKLAEKDKQIDYLTQEYGRIKELLLTSTTSTMSSMIDVFEDPHNRGGKTVSAEKSYKLLMDLISTMKVGSLGEDLSEVDFYVLLDYAIRGNRAEMEKKLKEARGNSKRITARDKSLIEVMEIIAEKLLDIDKVLPTPVLRDKKGNNSSYPSKNNDRR